MAVCVVVGLYVGKTMMAMAVSQGAGVPFHHVGGSDAGRPFVGESAAWIREIFRKVRKMAESSSTGVAILFIDEVDALGRKRQGPGEDSHKLNQLLTEMDGAAMDDSARVFVMAATNFPDELDPALLRPGRLDRRLSVELPTLEERTDISMRTLSTIKLQENVTEGGGSVAVAAATAAAAADDDDDDGDDGDDTREDSQGSSKRKILSGIIGEATAGMSGADIALIVNEAAISAVMKHGRSTSSTSTYPGVGDVEVREAVRHVVDGWKRTRRAPERERKMIAFYEAARVVASWRLPHVPRARHASLHVTGKQHGGTQLDQWETRLMTETEYEERLVLFLVGRVVEAELTGTMSSRGAHHLQRATSLARHVIGECGFDKGYGMLAAAPTPLSSARRRMVGSGENKIEVSAATDARLDEAVSQALARAQERCRGLVRGEWKEDVLRVATVLLEDDHVDEVKIRELLRDATPATYGGTVAQS